MSDDFDPVQRVQDEDRADRARTASARRASDRLHANDTIRVTINAPHQAMVSGNNVAIRIQDAAPAGISALGPVEWERCLNGQPATYSVNAVFLYFN